MQRKTSSRIGWTAAEDNTIIRGSHRTAKDLAEELGRTVHAVTTRRAILRNAGRLSPKSSDNRTGRPRLLQWTPKQDDVIIQGNDRTDRELADELGTLPHRVVSRRSQLIRMGVMPPLPRKRTRKGRASVHSPQAWDIGEWTDAEDDTLIRCQDRTDMDLANILGRTPKSVLQRRTLLWVRGVLPHPRTGE